MMQYKEACGERISRLAFGAMRLPLLEDGSIDQDQVDEMTRLAMESGVIPMERMFAEKNVADPMLGDMLREFRRLVQKRVDGAKNPDRVMQLSMAFYPVARKGGASENTIIVGEGAGDKK